MHFQLPLKEKKLKETKVSEEVLDTNTTDPPNQSLSALARIVSKGNHDSVNFVSSRVTKSTKINAFLPVYS